MPGGDRKGPLGEGSKTGRGTGLCGGYPTPGYTRSIQGRGAKRSAVELGSFGRGRGRRTNRRA